MVSPSPAADKNPRILLHYDRPEPLRALVAERFPGAAIACCTSYDDLPGALDSHRPEILFCIKFENRPYPREPVMACETLDWVSNGGAGVDHLVPWDTDRLTVTNASGVASDMMAEYVVGGMLALALGLPGFIRRQAAHRWQFERVSAVAGRTVAIVGLGRTGRAVARLAAGLGMRVVGTRANPAPTPHVETVFGADALLEALADADFVVVTAPLLGNTRHLVGSEAFSAMKPGARIVGRFPGGRGGSDGARPWPRERPARRCGARRLRARAATGRESALGHGERDRDPALLQRL